MAWVLQSLPNPYPLPSRGKGVGLGPFTTAEKILLGTPLSFNELSEQDWELLPGIGPATAKKIVTYRRSYGPLRSLEELDAVSGIGPKTISAIRSLAFRPSILEEHSDSDQSANPGKD